ncbi:MAG: hypothetical protein AAF604_17240 [Acidobacteriota bacterium]
MEIIRNLIFTEHVRQLVRGDVSAQELSPSWEKLRSALVSELRARSLFSVSPTCVGILGSPRWTRNAIDELTADCYIFVFLKRLSSLNAQLGREKANIEGLIFRNVRYFLHELQRKHDPLGFRSYLALRSAICRAVEEGTLVVVQGDPEVRTNTAVAPPIDSGPLTRATKRSPSELRATIWGWADETMPDLVTARGRALDPVIEILRARILELSRDGVAELRFGEVSRHFQARVRHLWSASWPRETPVAEVDHSLGSLAEALRPGFALEEREAFHQLVACVSEAVEADPTTPRTQAYLHRLWTFLWSHCLEDRGNPPSRRQLSETLKIPRARIRDLYSSLQRKVRHCLSLSRPSNGDLE